MKLLYILSDLINAEKTEKIIIIEHNERSERDAFETLSEKSEIFILKIRLLLNSLFFNSDE